MPWDGSDHGGFSHAPPWLPAYPDADAIGVAAKHQDPSSFLALYHRLLDLRRAQGWARGPIAGLHSTDDELVYDRHGQRRRYRVAARIEDGARTLNLPVPGRVLLRARQPHPPDPPPTDAVTLTGPDAVVVELATDGV